MDEMKKRVTLLDLPLELLENILSYSRYEKIAENRLVCRRFNTICQLLLNKGFSLADKYHTRCLKRIKNQLPRRESERKNHPLSRHCDILNTIETRISLLSMTFLKYIDLKMCCFIPGKVIDEINRVLWLVESSCLLPRAHELLQELRDISSMAMEHFDEKIVPILKKKLNNSSQSTFNPYNLLSSSSRDTKHPGPKLDIVTIHMMHQQHINNVATLRKNITDQKSKILDMQKKIQEQTKTIVELNHTVTDLNAKVSEQDGRLNELSRKVIDITERSTSPPMLMPILTEKMPPEPHLRRSSRVSSMKSTESAANAAISLKRKCNSSDGKVNAKLTRK